MAIINLLKCISIQDDTVIYIFSEQFRSLGCIKDDFWVHCVGSDPSSIPQEVLLIPLILNIAPLIWASGNRVSLDTMDEILLNSLADIKKILKSRYPEIQWSGELVPDKITRIQSTPSDKIAVLFSGGVDSTYTSLARHDQSQVLICVRGGDAEIADDMKWERKRNHVLAYAKRCGHAAVFLESNLAKFINGHWIRRRLPSIPSWWTHLQHGMGLIGLAALPAWQHKIANIYISSSFHNEMLERMSFKWGSDYILDNAVTWSGQKAIHYGEDRSRQDKIEFIAGESADAEWLELLVCNKRLSPGTNSSVCCRCKKCTRTMAGLLVTGHHYRQFGFEIGDADFINACTRWIRQMDSVADLERWLDIRAHLKSFDFYLSRDYSQDLLNFLELIQTFDFSACYRRRVPLNRLTSLARYIRRLTARYISFPIDKQRDIRSAEDRK